MSQPNAPRILVAPLDWGLGHATRCIPVIRELQVQGAQVLIMGSPRVLALLNSHIPGLEQIPTNVPEIRYSSWLPAWAKILLQANKISRNIRLEYSNLQTLIKNKQIDAVVSDNRYGLHSPRIPCVLITHQLNPVSPFFPRITQKTISKKIRKFLKSFDEIWIPDQVEPKDLSGKLSQTTHINPTIRRIGFLSRFSKQNSSNTSRNGVLVLLSGPEPQQGILLKEILRIQKATSLGISIICSNVPEKVSSDSINSIRLILNPNDEVFAKEINQAEYILCRSGYSSLMDLIRLNRTALLIPTPGQTEQEYLAKEAHQWGFSSLSQRELSAIKDSPSFLNSFPTNNRGNAIKLDEHQDFLTQAVADLLNRINRNE